jgi:hypothetical protein
LEDANTPTGGEKIEASLRDLMHVRLAQWALRAEPE